MYVLITGTSSGIGKGIAEKFLHQGHTVAGIDRLDATIAHAGYTHYTTDILRGELPELPPVEILINNAGVQNSGEDIDINLKGTIRITEAYGIQKHSVHRFRQCRERRGIPGICGE